MSDFNEYVIQVDRHREIHTQFFITHDHLEWLIAKYKLAVTDEDRKKFNWENDVINRLIWWATTGGGRHGNAEELWADLEAWSDPRTLKDRSSGQAAKTSKFSAKRKLGIN